jgi:hypothetical protein
MSIHPVKQCQRMKMNGTQCGSAALRNQKFCYFHQRCSPVQFDISTSASEPAAFFFLPVLEDAASIQATITQVCEHLLHRRLDPKKAGIVLYAMQVALSNLDRLSKDRTQHNNPEPSSSAPVSLKAISVGHDDSASISSGETNRLPPETIQACEEPRRFAV